LPSGPALSVILRISLTMRSTAWLAAINEERRARLATATHGRLALILELREARCRRFFKTSGRGCDLERVNRSRSSSPTVDIDPVTCLSITPFACGGGPGRENHPELCLTAYPFRPCP
jgi:hypothetical protein